MALLADSSAWIEYLRKTGSPTHLRLRAALAGKDVEVATTDVVVMEVLAGARHDAERDNLRKMLYGCDFLQVDGPADYEQAAEIHRACRRKGETVRKLTDCLIAAVAIRNDAELLHLDGDFQTIARHTALRLL
ncbi:MAG TPA: PIN domain nuclease [Solirubrobacteraceae bacterium]|nr:PIN domain nuclease [Solirubrobacteraceae bacterium]